MRWDAKTHQFLAGNKPPEEKSSRSPVHGWRKGMVVCIPSDDGEVGDWFVYDGKRWDALAEEDALARLRRRSA